MSRLSLALIGLLAGCSSTVLSIASFRSARPFRAGELEQIMAELSRDTTDKAGVLGLIGPPQATIDQAGGDVFVYRRMASDQSILNLNPAFVVAGAPPLSLYYDDEASHRDDLLMVFFDRQGRVRGHALSLATAAAARSRSARLGESLEEILP